MPTRFQVFSGSMGRALRDPANIKIAGAFATGLAVAVFVLAGAVNRPASTSQDRADAYQCDGQTWPYVDQRCAEEMKRAADKEQKSRPREVRVISTDQSAPPKVVLAPAAEPAAKEENVQTTVADEKQLPQPQGVVATNGIGSDKDAFVTSTVIATPPSGVIEPPRDADKAMEIPAPSIQTNAAVAATPEKVEERKPPAETGAKLGLITPAAASVQPNGKIGAAPAKPKRPAQTARTQRVQPTARELEKDYVPGPNEVVQERVTTTPDGRTITMRRIYRNVKPDAAYEASRQRRSRAASADD